MLANLAKLCNELLYLYFENNYGNTMT